MKLYVSEISHVIRCEKTVGESVHKELWIPAEELENFNKHIIGQIKVIESYYNRYCNPYFSKSKNMIELLERLLFCFG
jgi:hypothetical protein